MKRQIKVGDKVRITGSLGSGHQIAHKVHLNIRAVIHFSYPIEAKDSEEGTKKFYEIDGDEILKWMGKKAKKCDWEYEVVGETIPPSAEEDAVC